MSYNSDNLTYKELIEKIKEIGGLPDGMEKSIKIVRYIAKHLDKDNRFSYQLSTYGYHITIKNLEDIKPFTDAILGDKVYITTELVVYSHCVIKNVVITRDERGKTGHYQLNEYIKILKDKKTNNK